jgi:peptide/nickel transport system substrate-binding protein
VEGRKFALLVATDRYQDTGLSRLSAPATDARQLATVLRNPRIAGFEVSRLYNRPHHLVGKAIGDFYRDRSRDDLTLLYFTGHGVKDERGQLYLAMTDTDRENLPFTGVHGEQIKAAMEQCRARRNVLVLDCCYAGAFPVGLGAKGDTAVHALDRLGGRGCVVLTSSDAMQLSFEGSQVTETGPASLRSGPTSLFTRFLVEGLRTGRADLDGDGDITLDELYNYVHDRVVDEQPLQRPKKKADIEGQIYFAQNMNWKLPPRITDAVSGPYATGKLSALEELRSLHNRGNPVVKQRVLETLRTLADDDSKSVSEAASQFLVEVAPPTEARQVQPARPEAEQDRVLRAEAEPMRQAAQEWDRVRWAEEERREAEQERTRAEAEAAARNPVASRAPVSPPAMPDGPADQAAPSSRESGPTQATTDGGNRWGRGAWVWVAAAAAAVLTAVVAVLVLTTTPGITSGTPVTGGTAVYVLPSNSAPNYVFPFDSPVYNTQSNIFYLQMLMYRPLYWFGNGDQPTLNPSLSLANAPTFNGTKVTITLKHYLWSNGTQVTADDVVFWLNMMLAVPQDFGAYSGFPANVKDIKAVSPTELTMTMDKAYASTWFLYNDLSQVTPMPTAWDRTASGPSHCDTTVSDCAAVYSYLNKQALDLTGYVGSPIWSIVDGPWKLSAFNADGHITFVPNKSYSGPIKPKLAAFEEVPFTTDAAEYDVLRSPSSSTKIDVGYLPSQDAPAKPANSAVGANPLSGYTLAPLYVWGINYYVVNYQSSVGDHAAVIKQLYFRRALEYLMNQAAMVAGPLRGYGTETVGPVPDTPVTEFLSPRGKEGTRFPFSLAQAKSLLASHGWSVEIGGVAACTDPARCGSGITAGTYLSFNFPYAVGSASFSSEMSQLKSNAAAVGIKLNLEPETFTQVADLASGNCVVAKISCNWDFADWGGGWAFGPDYLPTGEQLFRCGAPTNAGGYCDSTDDSLINETLTSPSLSDLYSWQDYLASQLPVIWQPSAVSALTEVADNLKGVTPQNPTLAINPENWYFVK